MSFLLILQLSIILVAPVFACQSLLATQKVSNKAATDELLETVQRKETTSDEIIALIEKGTDINDQFDWAPLV